MRAVDLFDYLRNLADAGLLLVLAGILVFGVIVGWSIADRRRRREAAEFERTRELEQRLAEERDAALESKFAALSATALKQNNSAFIDLAQQVLARYQSEARNDLELKERAVHDLVWPIREALSRTEQQLHELDRERRETQGALNQHLESLTRSQQDLRSETRNLVQALRRPEVRGQWGELTLRRAVELAGLSEHCDFEEQVHTAGEDGALRPDMVIHLPAGRQVVVDVKTPLDAYLSAVDAADEAARAGALKRHAQQLRQRVRELSAKRYWAQFRHTPEFVILFIPGDQFLTAALDQDRQLLEDALARQVILATPTSFIALLRAVAHGWRQDNLNRNAEKIRVIGEEVYGRLGILSEHLSKLGRHLDASVSQFNRLVGSFESKVVPGARKFVELGIAEKRHATSPQQIESATRSVTVPDD